MLNYNETIKKINQIKEELTELKQKTDIYTHKDRMRELYKSGKTEELKHLESEFKKYTIKEQHLKRYLTAYISNAEKLFILENIQTILDIFNSYKGKKCGEKTAEKIRSEVKNKCNCTFGFNSNSMYLYLDNLKGYERIDIYSKYIDGECQKILNDENKINELNVDMFHLPTQENIIENVEEYTEQKEAEFLKLKEMYQALEEATSKYNKNNPFKHQNIRDGIRYID